VAPQRVRVLAWNLFHGRSRPAARHELAAQFAAMLAGWDWDVALLQEVPPWWPERLARCAKAQQRTALTSRNSLLPLRRVLAEHRPELMKSNGGGANAILARSTITEHRALRLRTWPERRVAQLARLACGIVLVNYHGSARVPLAEEELARLWSQALAWADGAPLILGGDLNLRKPADPGGAVAHVAQRDVDHIFARGLLPHGEAALLDRRTALERGTVELSDHPPLLVELQA
jgi:endonuclease/exonuclease/phosphatase family metal-dependent hydrolase